MNVHDLLDREQNTLTWFPLSRNDRILSPEEAAISYGVMIRGVKQWAVIYHPRLPEDGYSVWWATYGVVDWKILGAPKTLEEAKAMTERHFQQLNQLTQTEP